MNEATESKWLLDQRSNFSKQFDTCSIWSAFFRFSCVKHYAMSIDPCLQRTIPCHEKCLASCKMGEKFEGKLANRVTATY